MERMYNENLVKILRRVCDVAVGNIVNILRRVCGVARLILKVG
jgi:hypothetical protein